MAGSQSANTAERSGILLCLVGPAGGGKTSIAKALIAESSGRLQKSVSVTSRKMRDGETPGGSYHFVSKQEFEKRVAEGLFFEWEQVHGNLYGTLRETLDQAVSHGNDLVLDIDIRGALNLRRSYPRDVVIVFVLPPSPEVLRERIVGRGGLAEGELEARLATARTEYARILELYQAQDAHEYLVVNETLSDAVVATRGVLDAERKRFQRFTRKLVEGVCGAS
jgi:guanylate kinase